MGKAEIYGKGRERQKEGGWSGTRRSEREGEQGGKREREREEGMEVGPWKPLGSPI